MPLSVLACSYQFCEIIKASTSLYDLVATSVSRFGARPEWIHVNSHRPELVKSKRLTIFACPLLLKNDRSLTGQLDRNTDVQGSFNDIPHEHPAVQASTRIPTGSFLAVLKLRTAA
jgi:hypothetical protein